MRFFLNLQLAIHNLQGVLVTLVQGLESVRTLFVGAHFLRLY